jgi:hypothetical protein
MRETRTVIVAHRFPGAAPVSAGEPALPHHLISAASIP